MNLFSRFQVYSLGSGVFGLGVQFGLGFSCFSCPVWGAGGARRTDSDGRCCRVKTGGTEGKGHYGDSS